MASGAIKLFVQAAAFEMPRGIRKNNVSPNILIESIDSMVRIFLAMCLSLPVG